MPVKIKVLFTFNFTSFLANHTNGRAYATVLHPSPSSWSLMLCIVGNGAS